MAEGALFIGFGRPARARERQALDHLDAALAFCRDLKRRGEIHGAEPVLLDPHGGDLAGFVLLRGERSALERVRASDEFRRLSARAELVVDGFGVVEAHVGDAAKERLHICREQIEKQLSAS